MAEVAGSTDNYTHLHKVMWFFKMIHESVCVQPVFKNEGVCMQPVFKNDMCAPVFIE